LQYLEPGVRDALESEKVQAVRFNRVTYEQHSYFSYKWCAWHGSTGQVQQLAVQPSRNCIRRVASRDASTLRNSGDGTRQPQNAPPHLNAV
jgi:hypothetical protein